MLADEMKEVATLAVNLGTVKREFDEKIRERAEQGEFCITARVSNKIVGKLGNAYKEQGFTVITMGVDQSTNESIINVGWW